VDQAEAHFDLVGDSFNFSARKVHGLCLMYHGPGNHFGHTRWYSYVMYVKWKLYFGLFGDSVSLGAT
jgi:hypothetical protein